MTKTKMGIVATLVGATLTLAMAPVASAVPATTSATTGAPTTTAPAPSGGTKTEPKTLSGRDIWQIVKQDHGIRCRRATGQMKRIVRADAAAGKRLARWQTTKAKAQKSQAKHATHRTAKSTARVNRFAKLQKDGQALLAKIEAKCKVVAPAT